VGPARVRTVSDRVAPEAERLRRFADRISASRRPALAPVLGAGPLDSRPAQTADRLRGHAQGVLHPQVVRGAGGDTGGHRGAHATPDSDAVKGSQEPRSVRMIEFYFSERTAVSLPRHPGRWP